MHKPHTKDISLLLCLLPHSAHLKEVWKGMIHGLLSKHWMICCREEHYVVEVWQFCRGIVNRVHCPESLKQLFSEVSCRLTREKEMIGLRRVEELRLCLRQDDKVKDTKKITLLHQEHHPKDVSR